MRRCEPASVSKGIVLQVDDAVAVFFEGVGETASARLAAARAGLRDATGAGDMVLGLRPSGRPRLEAPYPELGVSLAHRREWLLAAFSPTRAVGADLEIDELPFLETTQLARDYFTSAEAAAVVERDEETARDLFLRLWVAKEAALKLTGRGIVDGLSEPDLSGVLDGLSRDGEVCRLPASSRLLDIDLAVCRSFLRDRRAVYLALARQVSP